MGNVILGFSKGLRRACQGPVQGYGRLHVTRRFSLGFIWGLGRVYSGFIWGLGRVYVGFGESQPRVYLGFIQVLERVYLRFKESFSGFKDVLIRV